MVNWAHLRPTVLFPSVTSPDWGKTLQSPWQPPSLRSLECFLADSVTISPTTSVEALCPDSVVPTHLHVRGYLSRILSYLCFTCFHFMLLYYFNLRGLCLFLHYINLVYLEYQGHCDMWGAEDQTSVLGQTNGTSGTSTTSELDGDCFNCGISIIRHFRITGIRDFSVRLPIK